MGLPLESAAFLPYLSGIFPVLLATRFPTPSFATSFPFLLLALSLGNGEGGAETVCTYKDVVGAYEHKDLCGFLGLERHKV